MKAFSLSLPSALVACGLFAFSGLSSASAQHHDHDHEELYLAWGQPRTGINLNVFDLHGDHYHTFSGNSGSSSHVPPKFVITPGISHASFTFGASDFSPFDTSYLIDSSKFVLTNPAYAGFNDRDLPGADFRLQLVSASAAYSISLFEGEAHGDHFHFDDLVHDFSLDGSFAQLDWSKTYQVRIELAPGSAGGVDHLAQFKFVDLNQDGLRLHYGDSPEFTIYTQAVPEPSTVALLITAGGAALLWRRRRIA